MRSRFEILILLSLGRVIHPAKDWKYVKLLWNVAQMDGGPYSHTWQQRAKEIVRWVSTSVSLENGMLSEGSQTQKTTHPCDSTQMRVGMRESAEAEKRPVIVKRWALGRGLGNIMEIMWQVTKNHSWISCDDGCGMLDIPHHRYYALYQWTVWLRLPVSVTLLFLLSLTL